MLDESEGFTMAHDLGEIWSLLAWPGENMERNFVGVLGFIGASMSQNTDISGNHKLRELINMVFPSTKLFR